MFEKSNAVVSRILYSPWGFLECTYRTIRSCTKLLPMLAFCKIPTPAMHPYPNSLSSHNSHLHFPSSTYSRSKSSNFSLYFKIFLLILLPSTQVTKSSILLVTRNAVSVIVSVPTLTCPCSIILVAACTVSAIRNLVKTTGNLRLQKADTVTFFSTSESFAFAALEGKMPISWSLDRRSTSCLRLKEESGGRAARRCASCLRL